VYDEMKSKNMISQVIEEIETNTTLGKELSRRKTNYTKWLVGFDVYAPANVQSSVNGQALKTELTFEEYDQYGNVLQFRKADGIPISYLWGYNGLYPVAELKGVTYGSIPSSYISNINISNPVSDAALRTLL